MLELVTYTNDFQRVVIKTDNFKRDCTLEKHLTEEANKLFGIDSWRKVADYDNSLENVTGWYAVNNDGQTLGYEAKKF